MINLIFCWQFDRNFFRATPYLEVGKPKHFPMTMSFSHQLKKNFNGKIWTIYMQGSFDLVFFWPPMASFDPTWHLRNTCTILSSTIFHQKSPHVLEYSRASISADTVCTCFCSLAPWSSSACWCITSWVLTSMNHERGQKLVSWISYLIDKVVSSVFYLSKI